jgi:hypothetical protein
MTKATIRLMTWLLVVALCASHAFAQATSADASPHAQASLQYELAADASGCPDRMGLQDAVAARLGYRAFVTDAENPARHVRVSIARERGSLVAQLSIGSAGPVHASAAAPSRSLRAGAAACDELVASLANAIAMALDASALYGLNAPLQPLAANVESAQPPPAACPVNAPAPACPVCSAVRVAEPERQPAPPAPLHLDAAIGVGLSAAGLPAPAAHLQVGFNVRSGIARIGLSGVVTTPVHAASTLDVSAQLAYATLAGCLTKRMSEALAIDMCSLGTLGGLTAARESSRVQTTSTRITAAVGAGVEAEWSWGAGIFLRGGVHVQGALTRHYFEVDSLVRWTSPALWLTGALGVGLRFV